MAVRVIGQEDFGLRSSNDADKLTSELVFQRSGHPRHRLFQELSHNAKELTPLETLVLIQFIFAMPFCVGNLDVVVIYCALGCRIDQRAIRSFTYKVMESGPHLRPETRCYTSLATALFQSHTFSSSAAVLLALYLFLQVS